VVRWVVVRGSVISIRDQERRQKEVERRIGERMRAADKQVRGGILARQKAADRRANDVIKRIEKGGVDPRPLPSLREDSMASMESMPSMESSPSMASIEPAETVRGVTGEAEPNGIQEGMPLEGVMPYDPASAEGGLAERTTEDTGAEGDPHLHNERKAGEMAQQMTEDTGAGGDMNLHAERKVEQMGDEMFRG
jgi:hypothetical protein